MAQEELFPIEQTLMDSPMLAWKKKHGVNTYHCSYKWEDVDWMPWSACFGEFDPGDDPESYGYGNSEEEAMRDLAVRQSWRKIKLWNETA